MIWLCYVINCNLQKKYIDITRVLKKHLAAWFSKATGALTHWGRVTHICVGTNTNIGSDNGLSPGRRQSIIWTNDGILLIGPLGTNFSDIFIEILAFSLKKMRLKVSSAKWRPFCLGLNVLTHIAKICKLRKFAFLYDVISQLHTSTIAYRQWIFNNTSRHEYMYIYYGWEVLPRMTS